MTSVRMGKVNSVLKAEIAEIVRKKLKDPRLSEWISITHVDASPDLQVARVYFSMEGEDLLQQGEPEALELRHHEVAGVLNGASGRIHQELERRVRMRHVPRLEFEYDRSLDLGLRLDKLLNNGCDHGPQS